MGFSGPVLQSIYPYRLPFCFVECLLRENISRCRDSRPSDSDPDSVDTASTFGKSGRNAINCFAVHTSVTSESHLQPVDGHR
jgi:hypothetical protein